MTVIVLVSESWFPVSLEPLQLQLQWRQLELYVPPAKEPIRGQTCLWPPLTMSGGRQLVGCSRRALWEAYPAELEKAPRLIRSLVVWCVSNCVVLCHWHSFVYQYWVSDMDWMYAVACCIVLCRMLLSVVLCCCIQADMSSGRTGTFLWNFFPLEFWRNNQGNMSFSNPSRQVAKSVTSPLLDLEMGAVFVGFQTFLEVLARHSGPWGPVWAADLWVAKWAVTG